MAWLGVEGVESGKIKTMTTFNSDGLKPAEGSLFGFFLIKLSSTADPVQAAGSGPDNGTAHPVLSPGCPLCSGDSDL